MSEDNIPPPNAPPEASADEDALIRNFLLVDHPNRGKLFSDLIARLQQQEPPKD